MSPHGGEQRRTASPARAGSSATRALIVGLGLTGLGGCAKSPPAGTEPEVIVFAAASLRNALTSVATEFEQEAPRTRVHFSFAGSNALAQQLIAAPRADLYFSASEAWMDRVAAAGAIEADSRRALLGNQLVVVVNQEVELELEGVCDLVDSALEHLVLGDPSAVPAGTYARQYLEATPCPDGRNAWLSLRPRVVPTPDVRAALAHAEASQHVAAIVYLSDAASSERVRVVLRIADPRAPRIVYPVALVQGHGGPAPRRLLAYLGSDTADRIFADHGFQPLKPGSP